MPLSASESVLSLALSTAARVSASFVAPAPHVAVDAASAGVTSALVLKAAGAGFSSTIRGGAAAAVAASEPVAPSSSRRVRKRGGDARTGAPSALLASGSGVDGLFTAGTRDGAGLGRVVELPVALAGCEVTGAGGSGGAHGKAADARVAAAAAAAAHALNGGAQAERKKGWFELTAPELTADVRRELAIVRNRTFLDPKRHYKSAKEDRSSVPTAFSIGTVVAGVGERPAPRAERAARAATLVESLLGDTKFKSYAGRTMRSVRERAEGGGIVAYQAKKAQAGAAWKAQRAKYEAANGKRAKKRKLY